MKICFFINTPAQVHFYKNIILELQQKRNHVSIVSRDYGITLELLNDLGFTYHILAKTSSNKYKKILATPIEVILAYNVIKDLGVDIVVGDMRSAYASKLLGKPSIIFSDSSVGSLRKLEISMAMLVVDSFLTTNTFETYHGKKHIKIDSYKELSYLHPNYFKPNDDIFSIMGLEKNEEFIVLRFNKFDAMHDIKLNGFSLNDKRKLINSLSKYARVFISSEVDLPSDFSPYLLNIPKKRIHDVLYYARMLIADTGTMVTESALLGTPAIIYHPNSKEIGNFVELEQKYGLIFAYNYDASEAIEKSLELIRDKKNKLDFQKRKKMLIDDKIDIKCFMVRFIENYPQSISNLDQMIKSKSGNILRE